MYEHRRNIGYCHALDPFRCSLCVVQIHARQSCTVCTKTHANEQAEHRRSPATAFHSVSYIDTATSYLYKYTLIIISHEGRVATASVCWFGVHCSVRWCVGVWVYTWFCPFPWTSIQHFSSFRCVSSRTTILSMPLKVLFYCSEKWDTSSSNTFIVHVRGFVCVFGGCYVCGLLLLTHTTHIYPNSRRGDWKIISEQWTQHG